MSEVVNVWGGECLRWWTSEVVNVWGGERLILHRGWWRSGVVNVWGGECLGGERLTIAGINLFTELTGVSLQPVSKNMYDNCLGPWAKLSSQFDEIYITNRAPFMTLVLKLRGSTKIFDFAFFQNYSSRRRAWSHSAEEELCFLCVNSLSNLRKMDERWVKHC